MGRQIMLTAAALLVCLALDTQAIQIPRIPSQRFVTLARTRERYTPGGAVSSLRQQSAKSSLPLELALPLEVFSSNVAINGDHHPFQLLDGVDTVAPNPEELMPEAPPISYTKFLTMQEKRTVVTIRYSGDAGLKPYFLTMAKKLKTSHPDIIIERRILPAVVDGEATFEVLVDGKVVIGKSRPRKLARGVVMIQNNGRRSVFVSMGELDLAISRARRKHRPSTAYGDDQGEAPNKSSSPQRFG